MENKHQTLIVNYIQSHSLEKIIQTSIRTLIQTDLLPDNPFSALVRHFGFYSAREDLAGLHERFPGIEHNDTINSSSYDLHRVPNYENLIGCDTTIQYINCYHTQKLIAAFSDALGNIRRTQGQFRIEVMHSISGSLLYKDRIVEIGEVSVCPVEIESNCIVKGPRLDPCFTIFGDYVYEDITRLGSTNSLHLVLKFVFLGNSLHYMSLEDILENKQNFVTELRNIVLAKQDCYLKILMFSSELDSVTLEQLSNKPSIEHYFNSSSIPEKIEYTLTHKYYRFHWIDSSDKVLSYEPVPLESIISGVFLDLTSAESYCSLYLSRNQSVKNRGMNDFRDLKKNRAGRLYKEGKTIESLWELVNHVTTSNESEKDVLLNDMMTVFRHPSCRLYRIARLVQALMKVIDTYYETNFKHYQRVAEALFSRLRETVMSAFACGSSAEMVIMKPAIDRMMDCITVKNSRVLHLHNSTLRVLTRLRKICLNLARNSTEMLIRQANRLYSLIQALASAAQVTKPIDHYDLLKRKQSKNVISISAQLSNSSVFPDEVSVITQYLQDTGVINLFIKTTRSLLLSYPLSPNPIKIYCMKLMSAMLRNDMRRRSDREILDIYTEKPEKVSGGIYSLFVSEALRKKSFPNLYSNKNIMTIVDPGQASLIFQILKNYESRNMTDRYMIAPGYDIFTTLAIVGRSLMNTSLEPRVRNLWHVFEDVYIRGPSMNAASHMFIEYVIEYAIWLNAKTPAIVIGIFTPFSEIPVANLSSLMNSADRSNIFSALLSMFQANTPIWLQYMIQYQGDTSIRIPATYISIITFFNMHCNENTRRDWTSLSSPHTFENFTKVFSSVQDYEKWIEVVPYRSDSSLISETLISELNLAFDRGQFYRGYIILLVNVTNI